MPMATEALKQLQPKFGKQSYARRAASLLCALVAVAPSFTKADVQIIAGLQSCKLDYTEYNRSGQLLDSDNGQMQGYLLALKKKAKPYTAVLQYDHCQGILDYHSAQANSTVDSTIGTIGFELERELLTYRQIVLTASAGASQRKWQRDIRNSPPYFGLNETYRQRYASIGAKLSFPIDQRQQLQFSLGRQQVFDGNLAIGFLSHDYDDARIDIDNARGYNVKLDWLIKANHNVNIILSWHRQYWNSPRSESKPLFKNGLATNVRATEPKSETEITRMQLAAEFLF